MKERIGRYQVVGHLGRGAMGVVYLAQDPLLNRQVAIKTIDLAVEDPGQKDFLLTRLLRDARAAAMLTHRHIVGVDDVLEEGDAAYLVMEYITGSSLAEVLRNGPPPDAQFLIRVLREMAEALDYTHSKGIVHRDIKPANVMIDATGSAKIMDFGIARISDTRTATPTGMVMGTVDYMSPEQIKGETVDGRSDQFALAAVAYQMMTGRTLYGQQTLATLAYKIVAEMPQSPSVHNPALPNTIDAVLMKALAKSPAGRFVTCSQFVNALEAGFRGQPLVSDLADTIAMAPPFPSTATQAPEIPTMATQKPPGPPTMPTQATAPPAQSGSRKAAVAGVLAAVVLAGGGLAIWKPWAKAGSSTPENSKSPEPPIATVTPPAPKVLPPAQTPKTKKEESKKDPATPVEVPPARKAPAPPATPEPSGETPENTAEPEENGVPQAARDAYRQAETLRAAGKFREAIPLFSKAIEISPQFARAYTGRGLSYRRLEEYQKAIDDYSVVIKHRPRLAAGAYADRGVAYMHLNKDDAALQDLNAALKINGGMPLALNCRGLVFLHRKQYNQALPDLDAAIRIAPNYYEAYVNRGKVRAALGDTKGAREDQQKADALNQAGLHKGPGQ